MNHWIDNRLVFEKTIIVHKAMINHELVDRMIDYSLKFIDIKDKNLSNTSDIDIISSKIKGLAFDKVHIESTLKDYSHDMSTLRKTMNSRYENRDKGYVEIYSKDEEILHCNNCRRLDNKISSLIREGKYYTLNEEIWYIKDGLLDYLFERKQFPHTLNMYTLYRIWLNRNMEVFPEKDYPRIASLLPIHTIQIKE